MSRKNETLQLDPCIAKQLESTEPEITQEVQWYLDNPSHITTFMDFRVDYAFKYILGHKPILRKLLNDILPVQVDDLEYLPNEIPVLSEKEKRAVFDVICTERDTGGKFLIEMQRIGDLDMDDRLVYYGATLIHKQVRRGHRFYSLRPVYVICIADYIRKHNEALVPEGKLLFQYALRETGMAEVFSGNRLQFYVLELPRLKKVWDALDENVERWCYLFENLHNFVRLPDNAHGFEQVFDAAQTGELKDQKLLNYIHSMITDYDRYTIGEYARREGREEGLAEGMEKGMESMAEQLRALGVDETVIQAAKNQAADTCAQR